MGADDSDQCSDQRGHHIHDSCLRRDILIRRRFMSLAKLFLSYDGSVGELWKSDRPSRASARLLTIAKSGKAADAGNRISGYSRHAGCSPAKLAFRRISAEHGESHRESSRRSRPGRDRHQLYDRQRAGAVPDRRTVRAPCALHRKGRTSACAQIEDGLESPPRNAGVAWMTWSPSDSIRPVRRAPPAS